MHDDSILPTEIAVSLGLICNIGAPLVAFWVAGKLPRFRLWIHGAAFVTILASPLMAMILGLPDLLPEEEESPGARFAFLPLIVETAIIVLLYCLAGAMFLSQSVHSAISDWHGADRLPQSAARPRRQGSSYLSKRPKSR
ncbi:MULTISPECIES: hypothetical protein [unclassified Rhizobium]|jgi:hypothetical protein|uniref:hypothetical protein n=1 Tax=unclassified Rhizobium TaxID=2613769 RepID=UPI0006469120|nr:MULTISPECIES: hypothetical protein [unclassified Rhizobium]OJY66379.1 MAG: hypothetical protein BGP09_31085 [Rhizobium sp. 60-20]RKD69039.1 hypothetical protein BJ928_104177 [Rhizobium sp. WW_1]